MKLAWSNLARQELVDIRKFSIERWGRLVALRYLEDLRDAAKFAASDPRHARALNGMFHILRVRSHYLIVEIDITANRLTVARILHSAMDLERHLPR